MARTPLFLERRRYRRRRVMDAVRLLPLLGFLLWMVPLLWAMPQDTAQGMPVSHALQYVFGIWGLLVAVAFFLWHRFKDPLDADADEAEHLLAVQSDGA